MVPGAISHTKSGQIFVIMKVRIIIIKFKFKKQEIYDNLYLCVLANWDYGEGDPLDPPLCGNSSGAG